LQNLRSLYCPLRLPASLQFHPKAKKHSSGFGTPVDSGYASNSDINQDIDVLQEALNVVRADEFERNFTIRWLTALIARREDLCLDSEEAQMRIIDEAASILASFSDSVDENPEEPGLTRDFSFATPIPDRVIKVRLNDAPLSGTDHTDVGLQSWGASIILSGLMCSSPERFDLHQHTCGSIVELGAGTGLISLTLAKLLPEIGARDSRVIATDYHPAVLENLCENIESNFGRETEPPVQTCLLDWSTPTSSPPLDQPAKMLVAADAIYAPEHAVWLRDCASRMLALDGIFWLLVTVRTVGKFEGIAETVQTAFSDRRDEGDRRLSILQVEKLAKRNGIGRGDETGYVLYKIGWTSL
jgi:hypothetical protein